MRLCAGSEQPPGYQFRDPHLGTCAECRRPISVRADGKIRRHGVRVSR